MVAPTHCDGAHTVRADRAHARPGQSPTRHAAATSVGGASMARPNLSDRVDRPWAGGVVAVGSCLRQSGPAYRVWVPMLITAYQGTVRASLSLGLVALLGT